MAAKKRKSLFPIDPGLTMFDPGEAFKAERAGFVGFKERLAQQRAAADQPIELEPPSMPVAGEAASIAAMGAMDAPLEDQFPEFEIDEAAAATAAAAGAAPPIAAGAAAGGIAGKIPALAGLSAAGLAARKLSREFTAQEGSIGVPISGGGGGGQQGFSVGMESDLKELLRLAGSIDRIGLAIRGAVKTVAVGSRL